jgi:hypothetical protein
MTELASNPKVREGATVLRAEAVDATFALVAGGFEEG